MALSLDEIKDLIRFGASHGLTSLTAEGVSVMYGPTFHLQGTSKGDEFATPEDENTSGIPSELKHYSAKGRAVFGKLP